MTTTLSLTSPKAVPPELFDPRLGRLKQMVLDSVLSAHSKRNYGKALDDLFLFSASSQPLSTRARLIEWRTCTGACLSQGSMTLIIIFSLAYQLLLKGQESTWNEVKEAVTAAVLTTRLTPGS